MAPKKSSESGGAAAAPGAGLGLTDNDLKLLDAIFKSAARTSKPNPLCSLEDIAQELGMKSGKVVTDRYRQILNKVGWFVNEAPAADGDATPKKTPTNRKKKTTLDADGDEVGVETPAPKKRKTTKKAAKADADNENAEAKTDKGGKMEDDDNDSGDI